MLTIIPTLVLFLICLLVIYGALSDLSHFRIPNWVSYGLVLLFAVHVFVVWLNTPYMPSLEFRMPVWVANVIIGVVVFVVSTIFWKLRFIGGGDVKFLTATSLWMGPKQVLIFLILLTVLAFVFVGTLKFLRLWKDYFDASRLPQFFKTCLAKAERNELPYGFPIGVAFVILAPRLFMP